MTHEQEITLLSQVLSSPAGFGLDLFGELSAERLESGGFRVMEGSQEHLFESPVRAAGFFVERRIARKLGFDFER